jgi:hypothetical protein
VVELTLDDDGVLVRKWLEEEEIDEVRWFRRDQLRTGNEQRTEVTWAGATLTFMRDFSFSVFKVAEEDLSFAFAASILSRTLFARRPPSDAAVWRWQSIS